MEVIAGPDPSLQSSLPAIVEVYRQSSIKHKHNIHQQKITVSMVHADLLRYAYRRTLYSYGVQVV